jgi:thymidylate synthase
MPGLHAGKSMRIFFLYSGPFGEQIINTISLGGLGDQVGGAYELRPEQILATGGDVQDQDSLFENPEAYIPADFPNAGADLLIVLGVHGRLSDLIPCIVRRLGVRSVLYPIDDRDTIPEARKTVTDELTEMGVHVEFPEPFCSLSRSSDPLIDGFLKFFGRPVFQVFIDPGSGRISRVEVQRDTPCGSASCIGGKLTGADTNDLDFLTRFCYDEQHNDNADNYCLAEMDPRFPLMQEAGDLLKDALFEGCGLMPTKDTILSFLERSGETNVEDLAVQVVGLPPGREVSGCVTRRAFNLYLNELEEEQRVVISDQNTVKLT